MQKSTCVTNFRIRVSAASEIAAAAYIGVSRDTESHCAIIKIVTRRAIPREIESQVTDVPVIQTNTGVYFAKHVLEFGPVSVGQLAKLKCSLCNATDEEVRIWLHRLCDSNFTSGHCIY